MCQRSQRVPPITAQPSPITDFEQRSAISLAISDRSLIARDVANLYSKSVMADCGLPIEDKPLLTGVEASANVGTNKKLGFGFKVSEVSQ